MSSSKSNGDLGADALGATTLVDTVDSKSEKNWATRFGKPKNSVWHNTGNPWKMEWSDGHRVLRRAAEVLARCNGEVVALGLSGIENMNKVYLRSTV